MLRLELISCNRLLATHAQQRSYSILEYAKRKALLASVSGWYGTNGNDFSNYLFFKLFIQSENDTFFENGSLAFIFYFSFIQMIVTQASSTTIELNIILPTIFMYI